MKGVDGAAVVPQPAAAPRTREPLDLEPIRERWQLGFGMTERYPTATEQNDYRDVQALLAEIVRLRDQIAAVRVLFSGGPDTVCRTTWREGGWIRIPDMKLPSIECVEVPMDDLRDALDGVS